MSSPISRSVALTLSGAAIALVIAVGTISSQPAKTVAKVKVSEDKPGLLKKAKITSDSAIAIAHATIPGGTIAGAEIEEEEGALIYSFDIKVAGKKGVEEIHVDAMTGKMLKREHENPASERAEAEKEKAEKAAKASKTVPPAAKKPPV